jgi:8-oxo-dGTP diphosphatase
MLKINDLTTAYIAAALIRDDEGRVLLVRKRGTRAFMQAGGKVEWGETPFDALRRELGEELGLSVLDSDVSYIGVFEAAAANEPGLRVRAELFEVALKGPVNKAAEIDEVLWLDPDSAEPIALAPLTRDYVLPFARQAT